MNKRVLSLVLALVMMFALPVFAAPTGIGEESPNGTDFLEWEVVNQYGKLIEGVNFHIYEKEATKAEALLETVSVSNDYMTVVEDDELPVVRYGNEKPGQATYPFIDEDGNLVGEPLKPNTTYYVRADFNDDLNTELVDLEYVDITEQLTFTTDSEGIVQEDLQTYVLTVPSCELKVQVLNENRVGVANVYVDVVLFEVRDNKYVLVDGMPVIGETIETVRTDANGFAKVNVYAEDGKVFVGDTEVPEGHMVGYAIDGDYKGSFEVYARQYPNIDDARLYEGTLEERTITDPEVTYVPLTDAELCPVAAQTLYHVVGGANTTATVRVWAMTNVSSLEDLKPEAKDQVPAEGTKVSLYNNATELFSELKIGDERAKAVIDNRGYADFKDVPLDRVITFLNNVADENGNYFKDITLPFFVKATEMPFGFYNDMKPIPVSVTMDDIDAEGIINVFLKVGSDNGSFNRIAGDDRYETAYKVALASFPNGLNEVKGEKTAIFANGFSFPDALAGGVLTEAYDAPMFLVKQNEVPDYVLDYLKKEGVGRVIYLGGPNSISYDLQAKLRAEYNIVPVRLEGDTRYDTAVEIGKHLMGVIRDGSYSTQTGTPNITDGILFVANGENFADALTASVPAAMHGAPLLLTSGTGLTEDTVEALKAWNPQKVILVGGPTQISLSLENEIAKITGREVERFHGEDRQITSMKNAKEFFVNPSHVYIASGRTPDALVSTYLAAQGNAPILLVEKDSISPEVAKYIEELKINNFTIIGGPNSVSNNVRQQISDLLVK